MKSIIQKEKKCYFCGSTIGLEEHHIYMNSLRKTSERNGFKVWLCYRCHRDNKFGVHGNRQMDLELKRKCQEVYEQTHTRNEWRMLIGRNYLGDDENG